ncbi:MAG TPA: pyridoxamine 5'-phosphate oxidase family protein [Dehalococcoidia bacterium]|jgi:uncharacterized pyridoxamine 5'-phosphate oxidase family protein|nr:pyridoxamine 5'-phosphate oxidase family protein [Dehalococcoidia bacterium]
MDVESFSEIEDEFHARVRRIVWCTVATVDTRGRPRTRILHPIWEAGPVGWIATGRHSLKAKHLARNDVIALTYWDPQQQEIHAQCRATWDDDVAQRRRIWELYKSTPPPLGYDPGIIWKAPDGDDFGVLRLDPLWIDLRGLAEMATGTPNRRWVAQQKKQ